MKAAKQFIRKAKLNDRIFRDELAKSWEFTTSQLFLDILKLHEVWYKLVAHEYLSVC